MLSHLKIKMSIRKCQEIIHVIELQKETKVNKEKEFVLDNKLFLDEFNNIFINEITKLPLVKKVDHTIDLSIPLECKIIATYCTSNHRFAIEIGR